MPSDSVRVRSLADLARSGLTAGDAQRLKIKYLTAAQTEKLTNFDSPSYALPYFDIKGRVTKFQRIRLLDPPTRFNKPDKALRYWQPPDTLPQLYFSPLLKTWKTICKDPQNEIWITEGEKKSSAACKFQIPCVGLGGVWSWRSAKKNVSLIEDFQEIVWQGRRVILVFDSDIAEKVDVQRALLALAKELVKLGAQPVTLRLPAGAGEKIGLDDFLVSNSVKALLGLETEPLLGGLGEELWKLNEELAYVENLEAVYRFATRQPLNRATLLGVSYANRTATHFIDGKAKRINLAEEWLAWPYRRTHCGIAYAPGESSVTVENEINTWPGWGVESRPGDVEPFITLLDHLFKNDNSHKKWFWQWLAYPLQNPGTKLYSAVVFFSLGTGIGKSLIGLTMGRIYGKNFSEISQRQLHGDFNAWAAEKQFVLGDDVTGSEKRDIADELKILITRDKATINKKYQPTYDVRDYVNYLFTTNQPDAFFLEDRDRRYFVLEVPNEPLPPAFYAKYDTWFRSEAGAAALRWYLENKVSCDGFNPKAPAPVTSAKAEMTELSRSDLDAWTHQLREDPDGVLRIDGHTVKRALWTINELRVLYDPSNERRTTLIALSKALRRSGFKALPVTTTKHGSRKLWAIRDIERWVRAQHFERRMEYEKDRPDASKEDKPKKF